MVTVDHIEMRSPLRLRVAHEQASALFRAGIIDRNTYDRLMWPARAEPLPEPP
jgi:hypothetical protein